MSDHGHRFAGFPEHDDKKPTPIWFWFIAVAALLAIAIFLARQA